MFLENTHIKWHLSIFIVYFKNIKCKPILHLRQTSGNSAISWTVERKMFKNLLYVCTNIRNSIKTLRVFTSCALRLCSCQIMRENIFIHFIIGHAKPRFLRLTRIVLQKCSLLNILHRHVAAVNRYIFYESLSMSANIICTSNNS